MKSNKILTNLIYIVLLSAIIIFSYAATFTKAHFFIEKKVLISDDNLGKLLVEFSLTSEGNYVGISQKLGFYIVDIQIQSNENSDKILEKYDKLVKNILYISQNFYDQKYTESEKLFNKLNERLDIVDSIANIQKIVELELFIQDPNEEYNKIKSRLEDVPEIYSQKVMNKFIPTAIFFVIVLIIFHFFKKKIFKNLKKL
tara:strand:- start:517 stop:1116 length:600 start_codon:yes stop_codon:yes gene_type:complete